MKRDASGRPIADDQEDKQKQDSKKPVVAPQAPTQAPNKADRGQKQKREDNDGASEGTESDTP